MFRHFRGTDSVPANRAGSLLLSVFVVLATSVVQVHNPAFGLDVEVGLPGTTYSHLATFETAGRSMWGSGSAFQIDETFFLGAEWGDKDFTPKLNLGKNFLQAFLAGRLHEGRVGLESKLKINSGDWDVSYPVVASFNLPTTVTERDIVTMSTTFQPAPSQIERPSLTTSGPEARFTLDYVADFEVTYGVGLDTGVSKTWTTSSQDNGDKKFDQDDWDNGSLFDRHRDDNTLINIQKRETLVDVGSGASGASIELGDWGTLDVQIPDPLQTSSTRFDADGSLTSSNTSVPWAELDADLIKLAAKIPALAPLEALSRDISLGGFKLEYDLLSVALNAKVKLRQEFEFNVTNLAVKLEELNSGKILKADLGPLNGVVEQDFSFTVPSDTESLDWEATVELDGEFTNRSYIVVEGSLDYDVLKLWASLDAFGIHKELFDFGPLVDGSIPWTFDIKFFDETIPFSGFEASVFQFESSQVQEASRGDAQFVFAGSSFGMNEGFSMFSVPEPNSVFLCMITTILVIARGTHYSRHGS